MCIVVCFAHGVCLPFVDELPTSWDGKVLSIVHF